jgi:hypothetical protein
VKYWVRLKYMSARDLGLGALMAFGAAIVLDETGPAVGFNAFCVGVLFGLAIGIGVFALGAFGRGRVRRG